MAEFELETREDVVELSKGYLNEKYQVQVGSSIAEFSSEHANAYDVVDSSGENAPNSLYALIFNPEFPTRLATIRRLKNIRHPNLQGLVDYGKLILSSSKSEKFAVILRKPTGKVLSEHIDNNGPFGESIVVSALSKQLSSVLSLLNDNHIVHGSINPDKVYFDAERGQLLVGECISDISGNSQNQAFDAIDQLLCHSACKGEMDLTSDYYSFGMLVLYMLSGRIPFKTFPRDLVARIRLENGSYESSIVFIRATVGFSISRHMDNLVKGLMCDERHLRWDAETIDRWHNREEPSPPTSKIHRQGVTSFEFNEQEYFGCKALANAIHKNWAQAKKELKLIEIVRWISLSVKNQELANRINTLSLGRTELILQDNKLMYLITLLDPDGPIRFKDFSGHISGIGFALANNYINKKEDELEQLSGILSSGLLDYWVNNQSEHSDFKLKDLHWRPRQIRKYITKKGVGFGMERALYEMNPGMPCQSKILQNYYVVTLEEVLEGLDHFSGDKNEDPIDRHIGAFIASRIDLNDDIRIRSLQNFPYVAKNPQVLMVGMLTVAQAEGQVGEVKSLTSWMTERLSTLTDSLNSRVIQRSMKEKLKKAAEEGNMQQLFKIISDPEYARKDLYGFKEARSHYKTLTYNIAQLKQQSNIQNMAYQFGLRIAVGISYLVCTTTLVYVILQAAP